MKGLSSLYCRKVGPNCTKLTILASRGSENQVADLEEIMKRESLLAICEDVAVEMMMKIF